MLQRENRLTSNFEYKVAKKYGKVYSSSLFHIYYVKPTNYTGPTKVGIVVSNRFDKTAVVRNRVKRLFREAIRLNFAKIKDDLWIVIYPKAGCKKEKYEKISAEFNNVLQKIPVTRESGS